MRPHCKRQCAARVCYTLIMDTNQPHLEAAATCLAEAFAQFERSIIDQAEAIVAAWRAAFPQCVDADGNFLENWEDILADPLDPPRG